MMGTRTTGFTVAPLSKVVIGSAYSSSVMRSWSIPRIFEMTSSDGVALFANDTRYRRDFSSRDIEVNPHAAHMDVAFDEKADVKVMRGPNSSTTTEEEAAAGHPGPTTPTSAPSKALRSRRNPSRSNVSRRSHSSLSVETPSRYPSSVSTCTLKQDSVSMDAILTAAGTSSPPPPPPSDDDGSCWESCSLMDGNRE